MLRRYKGQEGVERRHGNFKGFLAVAPMFPKNNRIEAVITVICLALLIFCLVRTVPVRFPPNSGGFVMPPPAGGRRWSRLGRAIIAAEL